MQYIEVFRSSSVFRPGSSTSAPARRGGRNLSAFLLSLVVAGGATIRRWCGNTDRQEEKLKLAEGGRKKNGNKRHGSGRIWKMDQWDATSLLWISQLLVVWFLIEILVIRRWRVHINIRQASTGALTCSFYFLRKFEHFQAVGPVAGWPGSLVASWIEAANNVRKVLKKLRLQLSWSCKVAFVLSVNFLQHCLAKAVKTV